MVLERLLQQEMFFDWHQGEIMQKEIMVSKFKRWLAGWISSELRAEQSRSRHYAMLYQAQLEDNIEMAQRLKELRIQANEQAQKKSTHAHVNPAAARPPLRSLLSW